MREQRGFEPREKAKLIDNDVGPVVKKRGLVWEVEGVGGGGRRAARRRGVCEVNEGGKIPKREESRPLRQNVDYDAVWYYCTFC